MKGIPPEIRRLTDERDRARRAKDFLTADALRDRIREAGYDVEDTASGPSVQPHADEGQRPARRIEDVPSVLDRPPTADVSVEWLVEGWVEDVVRGIRSFDRHRGRLSVHHVVVDLSRATHDWDRGVDVVRVDPSLGWARARNAGLRRSRGRVVVVVDGSVEATGDALGPLVASLEDPSVGLTGPFGLVTRDLREFHPSRGPDVDAVEAYLLAFRRDLLGQGVAFDPAYEFYRNADIDLSFQVKALGLRVTLTPVAVERGEHRVWNSTPEAERNRLSKRNFARFLRRWRGRRDLLVTGSGSPGPPEPGG